jgi:hypothetical protein
VLYTELGGADSPAYGDQSGAILKASNDGGKSSHRGGPMGRVVLYMFMTADGFIAGPQAEFDSYEPSSAEQEMANEFFRGADAIMFGRVCYQGFVEYWDALDLKSPTTPPWKRNSRGSFGISRSWWSQGP